ncbi:hypothetical protein DL98DRAFT_654831 [Cadophora sp. DSE1049]|nr:hypothetical protein DL98DRAFT_654831 [Cadophora sp. DSE1049]
MSASLNHVDASEEELHDVATKDIYPLELSIVDTRTNQPFPPDTIKGIKILDSVEYPEEIQRGWVRKPEKPPWSHCGYTWAKRWTIRRRLLCYVVAESQLMVGIQPVADRVTMQKDPVEEDIAKKNLVTRENPMAVINLVRHIISVKEEYLVTVKHPQEVHNRERCILGPKTSSQIKHPTHNLQDIPHASKHCMRKRTSASPQFPESVSQEMLMKMKEHPVPLLQKHPATSIGGAETETYRPCHPIVNHGKTQHEKARQVAEVSKSRGQSQNRDETSPEADLEDHAIEEELRRRRLEEREMERLRQRSREIHKMEAESEVDEKRGL